MAKVSSGFQYTLLTFQLALVDLRLTDRYPHECIAPGNVCIISGNEFNTRLTQYLISFVTNTQDTYNSSSALSRISSVATGVESDIGFQTVTIDGKPSVRRHSPAPRAFNVCSCSVALTCPDPLFMGGPYLCQYGDNCTKGSTVWTVPGLVTACTYYAEFLDSDLRCLYNSTCVNKMLSLFNLDMPKRLPLPNSTFQFTPLNSSIRSKFQPTTKIETLLRNFLLEEWFLLPQYAGHYNGCAPVACTYMVTGQSELLYVISTIISFFGGLVVTFRLLVPLGVRFGYWLALRWRDGNSRTNSQHVATVRGEVHSDTSSSMLDEELGP